MPRSKEEIISEMVDSGLFTDEEIKQAAAQSGVAPKTGLIKKGWEALAVPEQMSREGLGKIAAMVPERIGGGEPTGNRIADVARGTPKVLAETIAEGAPSFISRSQIATAGGLRGLKAVSPLIKGAGSAIAKGAESISGLEYKTPGVLTESANNPALLFGKGRKAVGQMYEAIADKSQIRQSFKEAGSHKQLIDEALGAAKEGTLTPQEALVARKTLDEAKKSIPSFAYHQMRDVFDNIAKTLSTEADAAYRGAIKSEALRNVFPTNKTGGSSIAKMAVGGLLGVLPAVAMSPVSQGAIATGAGAAARGAAALTQPQGAQATSAALAALHEYRKRKKK